MCFLTFGRAVTSESLGTSSGLPSGGLGTSCEVTSGREVTSGSLGVTSGSLGSSYKMGHFRESGESLPVDWGVTSGSLGTNYRILRSDWSKRVT